MDQNSTFFEVPRLQLSPQFEASRKAVERAAWFLAQDAFFGFFETLTRELEDIALSSLLYPGLCDLQALSTRIWEGLLARDRHAVLGLMAHAYDILQQHTEQEKALHLRPLPTRQLDQGTATPRHMMQSNS